MLIYPSAVFVLLTINFAISLCCADGERATTYLDVAAEMILKAKSAIPAYTQKDSEDEVKMMDCADWYKKSYNQSGVYTIWPVNRLMGNKSMKVFCNMVTDGGGWTVIQRRGKVTRSNDQFFGDWIRYKKGFGNDEEFWLGNKIFALTNQKLYSIRFDMHTIFNKTLHAKYQKFWIDDEYHNYTIHISNYTGNADLHQNNSTAAKTLENYLPFEERLAFVCSGRKSNSSWTKTILYLFCFITQLSCHCIVVN